MSTPVTRGPEGLISLTEAARRLGVHYMTAYRYVRTGRLHAEQHGGRWWVHPADAEEVASEAPGPVVGASGRPRWSERRGRLARRLLAGDVAGSWTIVEQALASGASPTDIYLSLLGPTLEGVGSRWAEGTIGVDDEHRAFSVALRVVGRLGPRFARRGPRRPGTVVLGGAPGDPHLLPVAMVADVLRHRGFDVVELGADVPERSFLDATSAIAELAAVGVSLSAGASAPSAERLVASLHRRHPGVPVVVGGPAISSGDRAAAIGADGWAPDALAAARLLAGEAGTPAPEPSSA